VSIRRLLVVPFLMVVTACSADSSTGSSIGSEAGPPPLDTTLIAEGRPLYDTHCASCHRIDGTGDENWRSINADGSYPAPPHDSTGHTWHHSDRLLIDLIANGSDFAQSRMPEFGDRLSTGEIEAILEYIKTWWGPEERAFQWEVSQQES
jgi:mono/diheme cytochrome c family protein